MKYILLIFLMNHILKMSSGRIMYDVVISDKTFNKLVDYKKSLESNGLSSAGAILQKIIPQYGNVHEISVNQFLEALLATKEPKIFTEHELPDRMRQHDWTTDEVSILGDVNVAMNVEIYDNGVWNARQAKIHPVPLKGALLYSPGALLTDKDGPDYIEVVKNKSIDAKSYNELIERRLLPLFYYINEHSSQTEPAVVTVPGIGCGVFSGEFHGKVEKYLIEALELLLTEHAKNLPHIKSVNLIFLNKKYAPVDKLIEHMSFKVRNNGFPALEQPEMYGTTNEEKETFKACRLHHIVAWDHLSLPGNDFFVNSRQTDDGVSAAATNSMEIITGVAGVYDETTKKYMHPKNYRNWEEVANSNKIKLLVKADNLKVYDAHTLSGTQGTGINLSY